MKQEFTQAFRAPWIFFVSRVVYFWFRVCCRGGALNASSIESIKANGFVIVANHVSYLDWLVLWGYLQVDHGITPKFVAKEKLFKHPIWRTVVNSNTSVKVSDSGDQISLAEYKQLRRSKFIVIFPEGTRSRDGRLGPFKDGAVKLAGKLRVPIVPIGLVGFFEAWPVDQSFPLPRKCWISVGEPIDTSQSIPTSPELRSAVNALLTSQETV